MSQKQRDFAVMLLLNKADELRHSASNTEAQGLGKHGVCVAKALREAGVVLDDAATDMQDERDDT